MLKWIVGTLVLYAGIGYIMAYNSEYPQISKQIDLKTMSLKKPEFIIYKYDNCVGTCRNYSSSSSYGGGSFGGK